MLMLDVNTSLHGKEAINSRKNESENSLFHYLLRHAPTKILRRNEMCENMKLMLNFH